MQGPSPETKYYSETKEKNEILRRKESHVHMGYDAVSTTPDIETKTQDRI